MSHSSRVSLALAAVVVAGALSAGTASAQGSSNAVNALPSPYQPVDGFFKLPEGRKIGSTAGIHVDRRAVETGLAGAHWPGRLDRVVLGDGRRALLDAAHNPAGARALAAWLGRTAPAAPPPLVFALAGDKDVGAMMRALAPAVGDVVVTAFADPRAVPAEALAVQVRAAFAECAGEAGRVERVHVAATTAAALETAWGLSRDIVVAGSIFLLGEAYPLLGRSDPFESGPFDAARSGSTS